MSYNWLIFFTIITFYQIKEGPINAQETLLNTPISIKAQSSPITSILEEVSRQCQCYFSYPTALVQPQKTVTINTYKGSTQTFLQQLFNDSLTIDSYKNQIILRDKNHSIPLKEQPETPESKPLSGVVLDKTTHQPIPYASIAIQGSLLGTISNTQGYFELNIPRSLVDSSVHVSCMGYYTRKLLASQWPNDGEIRLSAANISLQEVVVRSVGTNYIMEQTRQQLKTHYRTSPYTYEAFYRELSLKNEVYIAYHEALFEGYSPKGSISKDDLLLKKARQFAPTHPKDTILLRLKGGTEAALHLDIAHFKPDFLDANSENNYRYHITDIQIWHDDLVYIISFVPLEQTTDAKFEGELYVSFQDYSLLGASFAYTPYQLDVMTDDLIIKKSRKIKVVPTQFKYHVEYKKLSHKYHINYVKGDITIKAKQKYQMRYSTFNTIFEMTLTSLDTTQIIKPKEHNTFQTSSVFSEQIEYSSQEFWRYENLIIPEKEIMEAFFHSGFILETKD